jgi:hypothetical protein
MSLGSRLERSKGWISLAWRLENSVNLISLRQAQQPDSG